MFIPFPQSVEGFTIAQDLYRAGLAIGFGIRWVDPNQSYHGTYRARLNLVRLERDLYQPSE